MEDKSSEKEARTDRPHDRHKLGFRLSVLTATLVVLGMVILTLLPFAMEWGAQRTLLRHGARTANITDIDFNPMTGRLIVFDLQVEGPNGDKASMERLIVDVDLFPFAKKRIHFREVALTGFSVDIRQLEDGSVLFAGLSIPQAQETEDSEPEVQDESAPWGLGLKSLDVKELSVRFITPDLDETVVLHHFSLTDFRSWTPDEHGDHVLRAGLFGGTVDVEGTVRPFSNPIVMSTRIGIRDLSLEQLLPYLKDTPLSSLSGSVSGRGEVNTTLSLQPKVSFAGSVRFDVFSTDMNVHMTQEGVGLELEPGALNLGVSVNSKMDLGASPFRNAEFSAAASLEGTASSLTANGATFNASHDAFAVEVNGSYSDTGSTDPSRLSAKANLSLKGLTLKGGDPTADLLRLGALDIEGVEVNGPDDIRTGLTRVEDVTLLPRSPDSIRKDEPEEVFALGSLQVTGISLSDGSQLAVESLQVESFNGWVLREEGGDLEALRVIRDILPGPTIETTGEAQGGEKVPGSAAEDGMDVKLGSFTLIGKNRLTYRDLAVAPPFNLVVDALSAEVLNLGTREANKPASIMVNAGMGKYSSIALNGILQPPLKNPDVKMHIDVKAIDLPPLTPFTKKYLGYILSSGHLDTRMDVMVTKGTLDSTADIIVNRIAMEPVKEEDEQRAEERLGIPVKTALSLLTDKNDDISLTLPIKGDLNDPEFRISDVAVSATGIALKKGVSAYYKGMGATLLTGGLIPPGTFSILGKLFSGATTMTFEPILFDPLSLQLSDPGQARLDLMARKLEDKPKVRLVLCGKVTREDIAALRQADFHAAAAAPQAPASFGTTGVPKGTDVPDAAVGTLPEENARDYPGSATESVPAGPPTVEEVPLTEDEKERLIGIAKQRALAVKDYLAETGGLDPERLFVCYSEFDTENKEQQPRVDLSI